MTYMEKIGIRARQASPLVRGLKQFDKVRGLRAVARELRMQGDYILEENEKDVSIAKEKGTKQSLLDRLQLNKERIETMAEGLEQIADLDDPIGEMVSMKVRPNGLQVGKKRVPLGVVGIIYESRPNVTVDAFGLCFKTGNVTILRGGSDAIYSNTAIVQIIRNAFQTESLPADAVILVEDTDRAHIEEMMKMHAYIDVLIPRGGAGLIETVVESSTVPVIETGTGNCHVYVDEYADIAMAVNIIENAKTQRMGVCNACESLVVHEKVASEILPLLSKRLETKCVELRGDEKVQVILPEAIAAKPEDWGEEYLDAILSIKVVPDLREAISHINTYSTGHSEAIITKDYANALAFQEEIDSAAVYVNASTRFTDGFEFGFGAEIGISTQKLHARGPMGLEALTTTKYVIFGSGQVR